MNVINAAGVWVRRITSVTSVITFAGYVVIMLLTVVDVFMRQVFKTPVSGTYEIVQYTLMASIFASFAYCQSERGHIHITMVIRLLPQKLRFAAYSLTGLISTVAAAYLGYAAIRQAELNYAGNYVSGILRFPLYPFFWIMAITMFIFTLALLYDVIRSCIAIVNKEFADEIQKDWS